MSDAPPPPKPPVAWPLPLRLAVTAATALGVAGVLYITGGAFFKPGMEYREARGPAGVSGTFVSRAEAATAPSLHVIPPLLPSGRGEPAPAAAFVDGAGKAVRLSDFKGQVVVLNLWATWCAPCIKEMPTLAALQASMAGKPVKVVALSVDRASASPRAKAFIAQNAPLAFYQDPQFAFPSALKPPVMGFPTTLIYDKRGRARATVASDVDWAGDQVRRIVGKLAAEPA